MYEALPVQLAGWLAPTPFVVLPLLHGTHRDCANLGWYVFSGHGMQAASPCSLYIPGTQGTETQSE